MELKEFINNTLTQIAEGVQGAIDQSEGRGYLISPVVGNVGETCIVHFDLLVESQKEGGANIKVLSGNVSEKVANRINFDVAMTLPHPEEPANEQKNCLHRQLEEGKKKDTILSNPQIDNSTPRN